MSVDSENEKILQEFMDVLDNQEEESQPTPPPQPKKQQASLPKFQFSERKQESQSMQMVKQKQIANGSTLLHQNSSFTQRELPSPTKLLSTPNHGQSLNKSSEPRSKNTTAYSESIALSEMIDPTLIARQST